MATYILLALTLVAIVAFFAGRARATSIAGSNISSLHSRPSYHGGYLAILTAVPALFLTAVWNGLSSSLLESLIKSRFADTFSQLEGPQSVALMRDIRTLASRSAESGAQIITSTTGDLKLTAERAAEQYAQLISTSNLYLLILCVLFVAVGF